MKTHNCSGKKSWSYPSNHNNFLVKIRQTRCKFTIFSVFRDFFVHSDLLSIWQVFPQNIFVEKLSNFQCFCWRNYCSVFSSFWIFGQELSVTQLCESQSQSSSKNSTEKWKTVKFSKFFENFEKYHKNHVFWRSFGHVGWQTKHSKLRM